MEPTPTQRSRYRRAALLGGGLAAASTAVASLLLWWSLSSVASAHSEDLPVAEAMVLLTGLTTGLVAAAVAYTVGTGTVVLVAMASGGSRTSRRTTPWAARSAAVLLVLVMGTPGAYADASAVGSHPHADTAMGARPVVAEQEERLPVPAALREPDDRDTFSLRLSNDSQVEATDGASDPPSPVPLPGWQSTRAEAAVDAQEGDGSTAVVVKRGDTLWSIAAADLAPGASDAQIAKHWPRWYEANRLTIGPDPDIILPGHILQPPTPRGAHP